MLPLQMTRMNSMSTVALGPLHSPRSCPHIWDWWPLGSGAVPQKGYWSLRTRKISTFLYMQTCV